MVAWRSVPRFLGRNEDEDDFRARGRFVDFLCQISQRDDAIVAWHEVPGKGVLLRKNRPVGYGVIRAVALVDATA
jgi:hypothetical protein